MNKTVIIIPIYNTIPTDSEILSIRRNTSVLSAYDIYAIHPEGMNLSPYKELGLSNFISFNKRYFGSNKTYSRLILSEEFYTPFLDYEYMLIAQTDTYILNTNYSLNDFIEKKYEYWGAPWPNGPFNLPYGLREYFKSLFVHDPRNLHVGNGGFTLRNIQTCHNLVKKHHTYIKYIWCLNEDLFFSQRCKCAPYNEASTFALETNMSDEISKGNIPFAVHAWKKYLNSDITQISV